MTALFTASDVALAFRLMRKQPVLTLTAVLALATGVFMATTGFTFLEAVLWARIPFEGGDRFVIVEAYTEPAARRAPIEGERFRHLRDWVPALQHLGAFDDSAQNLILSDGEVALVAGIAITPDSFAVLPFPPIVGRTLNAADAAAGATPAAVIRESLWRRHFSADAGVVGRVANFSGVQRTIVGVMPDTLEFPNSPEVWLPLVDTSTGRTFGVLASIDGLVLAAAQVASVSRQFEASTPAAARLRTEVMPLTDALSRGLDVLTAGLVFVLVLVLLVISANVANLVLARTLARRSELAIRTALGASRARLVGQIFLEVFVLGIAAAATGLASSQAILQWVQRTMTDMPFWISLDASPRTMLFVVTITVLAAAVGGALPALKATRGHGLATSSRSVAHGFSPAVSAMLAIQIALSIAALQAALVVARGVAGYMQGTPVTPPWQVLTARAYAPEPSDPRQIHATVLTAVEEMPGVRAAGLSTTLPRLSPPTVMTAVRTPAGESPLRAAPLAAISAGFLETLGGQPSAGRLFTPADYRPGAPAVAIVNQPFVEKFFGGASPIGQHLRIARPDDSAAPVWRRIIGVVPDLGLSSGDDAMAAGLYVPLQDESSFHISLAVGASSPAIAAALRSAIAQVDPRIQIREVIPLEDVGSEDRAVFAGIGGALTALGGITLLLSMIGVYAMLSLSVTQRTRELAIRSALGATGTQILRSVVGRAAVPLVAGAVAGPALGALLVAGRGIFAFRLPADAGPFAGPLLCLLILGAGVLAALVPGRRALTIPTADALRAD